MDFDRSRERSLCCEGGGGRMWIDIPGERLAETRVKDAAETGAEILITTCPFCELNFADAIKDHNYDIQVMDLVKLLNEIL